MQYSSPWHVYWDYTVLHAIHKCSEPLSVADTATGGRSDNPSFLTLLSLLPSLSFPDAKRHSP